MVWQAVETELARAADEGRTVELWLRDDDAVEVTPALERLRDLCGAAGMPVLLAVIPARARPELGAFIDANPSFTPCQHGYAHANQAAEGQRACELGGERPLERIEDDLRRGRALMKELVGSRLSDCLVPPWNRINNALIPRLPGLGYDSLSTFGPPPADVGGIARLNADLDMIDWRQGRVGRPLGEVARKLAALIAEARGAGRPIGILTHHLVHDATAWRVLEDLLGRLKDDRRVAYRAAASL